MPPKSSERDFSFALKDFAANTASTERAIVVRPMNKEDGSIFTSKKEKVTPTTKASMDVPIARGSIAL